MTIPKEAEVSELGYFVDYDSVASDDKIAEVHYYIDEHFLGKATLKLNTKTGDKLVLAPDKESETVEYTLKDDTPINIWWILGGVAVLIVLVIVIIILVKTKEKRKIKRDRKRMFKNSKKRKR